MENNNKQLLKLAQIFNADKIVTPEDISAVLKGILEIMNSFKKGNEVLNSETKQTVINLLQKVSEENTKLFSDVTHETSKAKEDMMSKMDTHMKEMKKMCEELMLMKPEDGMDADEEAIIKEVLAQIKLPEYKEVILDDRKKIVDKINSGGTEKINATEISGLPQFTREVVREVGGGFVETPLKAGTNVTITKDAQGANVINATGGGTVGPGTINEIAYFDTANTVASLPVATYPSLTEFSYIKGLSSAIQTQLGNKQPLDAQLTSVAALAYTGNAGKFIRVNAGETDFELATVAGSGDVIAPATNTDSYIPQWNGANSKTLKDGLAVPAGGLAGLTALGLKLDTSAFSDAGVTSKLITGFTSGAGALAGTDTILQAINKLDGNIGTKQATLVSGTNIKTVGGVSLLGSGDIGIITSAYGGTGNGFTKFTGATTAEKTYTLPDASTTILTKNYTGALATGIVKNTTTTGELTIAVAGDFPTLNQNTTGSAATLTTTRTIWGQNFNGSANVTGNITLGVSSITMTGSIAATANRVTKLWATDIESTNMPTVGGTAILTSLTAPQFTTIELGHATDTTFSRVSAGVAAIEGMNIHTDKGLAKGGIITGTGANTSGITTVGTDGQVLTADAASAGGVKWATASGGFTPYSITALSFETIARYSTTATGGGTKTLTTNGINIQTSATGTSSIQLQTGGSLFGDVSIGSPFWSANIYLDSLGTAFKAYIGMNRCTITGSDVTYTDRHIGFKFTRVGSGTVNLVASQADGTTETTSASLTTLATGDKLELIIKVNGTTSVDYYWRKNDSALSSATNLTTNIPSGATMYDIFSSGISNVATATDTQFTIMSAHYQR